MLRIYHAYRFFLGIDCCGYSQKRSSMFSFCFFFYPAQDREVGRNQCDRTCHQEVKWFANSMSRISESYQEAQY